MRRIVVEMSVDDFSRLKGGENIYRQVRSLESLSQLRSGPKNTTAVVRLAFKDAGLTPEAFYRGSRVDCQVLDESGGQYTCLLVFRQASMLERVGLKPSDGYIVPPMEIANDRARVTFVGTSPQVGHFLDRLTAMALHHRTISLTDYRISPSSPLAALTEKQRRVLLAAYNQGYYDRPRRTSSLALAKTLGLSSSTFVDHRLKAERRVLSVVLGQSGRPPHDTVRSRRR
jgi:hypothetical protein